MSEIQQTQSADAENLQTAGTMDAKVEESSNSTSVTADAIEQAAIEKVTGRKFASVDEAKKHYENLNRLVGDQTVAEQRKRAEIADNLARQLAAEQGVSLESAYDYMRGLTRPQAGGQDAKALDYENKTRNLERQVFLLQNGDAAPYMDRVEDYVKATGKSYQEAYTFLYGDVLKESARKKDDERVRQEKMGAQVLASTSAPPPPVQDDARKSLDQVWKDPHNADSHINAAIKARLKLK